MVPAAREQYWPQVGMKTGPPARMDKKKNRHVGWVAARWGRIREVDRRGRMRPDAATLRITSVWTQTCPKFGPGTGLAGCGMDEKRSMGPFASTRWALVSTQTDQNGAKRTKWVGALELPLTRLQTLARLVDPCAHHVRFPVDRRRASSTTFICDASRR